MEENGAGHWRVGHVAKKDYQHSHFHLVFHGCAVVHTHLVLLETDCGSLVAEEARSVKEEVVDKADYCTAGG